MIFKQEMVDAILSGRKTVTRRPVKYNETGKYLPSRYEVGGGPGGTYALQGPPEKGSRARAKTIPGYRLRVTRRGMMSLGQITDADARREGFEDRTDFLCYWHRLYGDLRFNQWVWRYEFELVPAASKTRLPSLSNGGGERG